MKVAPQVKVCATCKEKFIRTNTQRCYCPKCYLDRTRTWRANNRVKSRTYYHHAVKNMGVDKHRQMIERQYKWVESSPQAYISRLFTNLESNNKKRCKRWKVKPIVDITRKFLYDLYGKQNGLCAITKMKMTWHRKDLKAISIDRIDSKKLYTKTNVQLICRWVNIAKNTFSNDEIITVLEEFRNVKH